jgi:hypothetical protein
MKIPFLLLAATLGGPAAMAWTPPEKPDPRAILNEARDNRMAGRFEDALQKHLWFHRESLKHEPAMVGVRSSFAIADWARLGVKYPPAMDALLKERDAAAARVMAGKDVLDAFDDVAAIDRELGDGRETYRLFLVIESRDEGLAREASRGAQEALVEMKDFPRAGKYLDPERELRVTLELRTQMGKVPAQLRDVVKQTEDRMLANRIGQIVAILVLAGRTDDAKRVAGKARAEFPGDEVEKVLVRALEGQVPPPLVSRADKAMLRGMMR